MNNYPKKKPYNFDFQKINMASRFPQFKAIRTDYGFDFIGVLKPRDTEYIVKIIYNKFVYPKVFVISPALVPNKHMYEDGSICIYKLTEFKWRKELLVSKYILPLTAMWLHFYDIFLLTGEWLGPEALHE